MLLMKESVLSFEEKTTQPKGLPTFKLPTSTKQFFKTNPLNIIFHDFSL